MKDRLLLVLWLFSIVIGLFVGSNILPLFVKNADHLGLPEYGSFHKPFRLIYWTIYFDYSHPRALIFAYSAAAIIAISTGIILLWLKYRKPNLTTKGIHGSSRWMKPQELQETGLLTAGGIILGQTNKARYQKKEPNKWTIHKQGDLIFDNSNEHLLINAPTRRGKGINNVIPTLLHWTGSTVVYDIKKENWNATAGWRKQFSHILKFEPTSHDSVRFNPLSEIEKGDEEVAQVQNLCEMLTNPYGETKKDHRAMTATAFLVGVVLHVLYSKKEKSISGIYKTLNDPESSLVDLFVSMRDTKHLGDRPHPIVAEVASNSLNKVSADGEPSNEMRSIISTASSYLSLYQDPVIAKNTSTSDFTISDLMNDDHPVSLYLVVNPQNADRIRPLTRLIIEMISKKLVGEEVDEEVDEEVKKHKHRLLFLIDEFPTLGYIDFFERQLAFFAGYGIKCMLIAQSFNQLYKHYTKNTSILDNCQIKVILGANSPEDANIITQFLGKETTSQKSTSVSGKSSEMFLSGKSVSHSATGKQLMTTDEILRLSFDEIIILFGGNYPYKGKKIMYYQDSRFIPRANMSVPKTRENQKKYFLKPSKNCWDGMIVTQPEKYPYPKEYEEDEASASEAEEYEEYETSAPEAEEYPEEYKEDETKSESEVKLPPIIF